MVHAYHVHDSTPQVAALTLARELLASLPRSGSRDLFSGLAESTKSLDAHLSSFLRSIIIKKNLRQSIKKN